MRGLIRAASLALIVGAVVAGTASAQAAPKIGFINSAAILAEAPGREAAETRFKTEVTAYEAQLNRMRDSLEAMAAAFEREAPAILPIQDRIAKRCLRLADRRISAAA